MAQPGPMPRRADEQNLRALDGGEEIAVDTITVTEKFTLTVTRPAADQSWHPVALQWYEALTISAQIQYYEPSDWATAYLIAESISRDLRPQAVGIDQRTGQVKTAIIPLKGSSLTAYLRAMTALMVTEADRRRSQINIKRVSEAEIMNLATEEQIRNARANGVAM